MAVVRLVLSSPGGCIPAPCPVDDCIVSHVRQVVKMKIKIFLIESLQEHAFLTVCRWSNPVRNFLFLSVVIIYHISNWLQQEFYFLWILIFQNAISRRFLDFFIFGFSFFYIMYYRRPSKWIETIEISNNLLMKMFFLDKIKKMSRFFERHRNEQSRT